MSQDFDAYLRGFDHDERLQIKIGLEETLDLYAKGEVQLIDIRFREEHAAWSVAIGQHVLLNELPERLDKLGRAKVIVPMCPHYDRC
ncbi:MAG: rhodanese-like domain-containing protein [Gemmobacter sp.]